MVFFSWICVYRSTFYADIDQLIYSQIDKICCFVRTLCQRWCRVTASFFDWVSILRTTCKFSNNSEDTEFWRKKKAVLPRTKQLLDWCTHITVIIPISDLSKHFSRLNVNLWIHEIRLVYFFDFDFSISSNLLESLTVWSSFCLLIAGQSY